MKRFHPQWFADLLVQTQEYIDAAHLVPPIARASADGGTVSTDNAQSIRNWEIIEQGCLFADLPVSALGAKAVRDLCARPDATFGQARQAARDFKTRVIDELKTRTYLAITPSHARYLASPNLFGEQVAERFPSAIFDIEEAGKCVAFELGTATVFHLVRVMEVGLADLARRLGIAFAPSWESYITQITTRIGAKHKAKGIKWRRDEAFFRDVQGDLVAIKQSWRNPTMHVRRNYTADEAEQVFNAVRIFMQRLAVQPTPKASAASSASS